MRWRLPLALALIVFVLDQATKWLIVDIVMQPPRIIDVTGFFNLVLTFNRGVSFGLFGQNAATWQSYALSALALAIVAGLVVWLSRVDHWLPATAIGLVIGGAIGNTVDRLFRSEQAVVDFLDFYIGSWHWPAFNVADSAITMGVVLLLYDGLLNSSETGKNDEDLGGSKSQGKVES